MELSSEDALRLNVLLAGKPQAIRIDESSNTVHALSEQGEATVRLHPVGRSDQYLKRVRELLSGHVLGSPGGYPVYLQRWTRMGQMRDGSLEQLLLLAEPEAVVAAVCAPGITDELARRAWWAMPEAENARRMLSRQAVVDGRMGPILAEFLVEYLPFESEPEVQIDTVRLILQPGLISDDVRAGLWKKAARKNAYYVGFLAAVPDALPGESVPHPLFAQCRGRLTPLAREGNNAARLILKVFSGPGQVFLATVRKVLERPATQDVVTITLDLLGRYFHELRPEGDPDVDMAALQADAQVFVGEPAAPAEVMSCMRQVAGLGKQLRAMRVLSGMGYGVVRPVFRDTTAIGSLMRRKLEPVITPVLRELATLLGENQYERPRERSRRG
jgi:hypothetical protein